MRSGLEVGGKLCHNVISFFSPSIISPPCISYLWRKRKDEVGKDSITQEHGRKLKLLAEAPLIMLCLGLPFPHSIVSKNQRMLDKWKFVFWLHHTACRLFEDETRTLWSIISSYSYKNPQIHILNSVVCDFLILSLLCN